MKVTLETWFISDTHFGHKNIIKYCNRPVSHEAIITSNWKMSVKPNDLLLHLGDITVFYGSNQKEWETKCALLPGDKKLIKGNHDIRSDAYYRKLGYGVWKPFIQNIEGTRILFSHYPLFHDHSDNWDLNIHGHSHTHKKKNWSKWHINISVEHMRYKPVKLKDILK